MDAKLIQYVTETTWNRTASDRQQWKALMDGYE